MKKFKQHIDEMSMSVTLKPKKNNMYKVTGVGKKMAAHGGIKPGEKIHDRDVDSLGDSGIKVKYDKPKPTMKKESSDTVQRMADTWNDHADNKHPKVQKHIKKAEKAYNDKDHEGFIHHTQRAADHAYTLKYSGKPKGVTQFDRNRKPKPKNEAIERRMDRKTIIATDPATGRKVVKVAPKKEIDIGKGKHESFGEKYSPYISIPKSDPKKWAQTKKEIETRTGHARNFVKPKPGGGSFTDKNGVKTMSKGKVNEISDTTKLSYINKANKAITDREKLHLKIGAKVDKDKTLEKMRKGVAMAKSKLDEAMDPIGKSGRHDIHHTDTSDYNYHSSHASKVSHGGKGSDEAGEDQYHYKFKDHKIDVNDDHTDTKMSHVQQRVKASGVSPKHHDAVSKSIHKHITMEGVMKMYELKISTMQKYKQAANKDVQDGENARHKGYPEKDIDKRQDKRYKGIDTANKRIDKKQVKMAKGVAFDKRYKGGNMTGASKAIDKIKPGLSDHPKVKSALRRANEEIGE